MQTRIDIIAQEGCAGRYLTFMLSTERYGLDILRVQEIIGVPKITRVPMCPVSIRGVINLRGKIIPLVDLRLKFGLPKIPYNERTCVVVVNIPKADQTISVGIIVDTVLEVINFAGSEIQSAPNYGIQVQGKAIIGMGRKEEGPLNILIDIEKAMSADEISQLSSIGV